MNEKRVSNILRLKKVLFLGAFFVKLSVVGQITEIKTSFNSGVFNFDNSKSDKENILIFNNERKIGYTQNPYSERLGLLFGIGVNLIIINPGGLRYGFNYGFERMQNTVPYQSILIFDNKTQKTWRYQNVNNQTKFTLAHFNFSPIVGYQLSTNEYKINLDSSLNLGICYKFCKQRETGIIQIENEFYEFKKGRFSNTFDFRPTLSIGVQRGSTEYYFSYSRGVSNYRRKDLDSETNSFIELFRLGLTFTLFKKSTFKNLGQLSQDLKKTTKHTHQKRGRLSTQKRL